jgi:hypothetical protein
MTKQKEDTQRMGVHLWPRGYCWVAYKGMGTFSRGPDCKSKGGARRSGNAWAKRMNLTPEWE